MRLRGRVRLTRRSFKQWPADASVRADCDGAECHAAVRTACRGADLELIAESGGRGCAILNVASAVIGKALAGIALEIEAYLGLASSVLGGRSETGIAFVHVHAVLLCGRW